MRPVPISDEEYLAIGKVIESEQVKVENASQEQVKLAKEALQALVYGAELIIEGLLVKMCVEGDKEQNYNYNDEV